MTDVKRRHSSLVMADTSAEGTSFRIDFICYLRDVVMSFINVVISPASLRGKLLNAYPWIEREYDERRIIICDIRRPAQVTLLHAAICDPMHSEAARTYQHLLFAVVQQGSPYI